MKTLLAFLTLALVATTALAAPSLPIDKMDPNPAVSPYPSWTGPQIDPHAREGQWFLTTDGEETVREYEFHDNVKDNGGGDKEWLAIQGYAQNVVFDSETQNIVSFDILATITNDTPGQGRWEDSTNSHGEYANQREQYEGTLYDTMLTIEFAISDLFYTQDYGGPYTSGTLPTIVAVDPDAYAWYCYNSEHPDYQAGGPGVGNYYVPAWEFGDIAPGQSVTRELKFKVSEIGITSNDPRYEILLGQEDLLLNRTTSLKISDWVEDMAIDTGEPYPTPSSTCSVFHSVPEPGTISLLAMLAAAGGLAMWRRKRA